MANPTTFAAETDMMAVLVASTSQQTITLNPSCSYALYHNSQDNQSTPVSDVNSIFLACNVKSSTSGTAVATGVEATNKAILLAGGVLTIGPNISALKFICASGTPTFNLIRQDNYLGRS